MANTFNTDIRGANKYNKFIEDAKAEDRMDRAINIMFTGGIGGKNADMGYPDESLTEVKSQIDYVRVFTPINRTINYIIPKEYRDKAYFIQNGRKTSVYSESVEPNAGVTYRTAGIPEVHFTDDNLKLNGWNWDRWDEEIRSNIGGRGITAQISEQ